MVLPMPLINQSITTIFWSTYYYDSAHPSGVRTLSQNSIRTWNQASNKGGLS
nr:MAG TPA: hypothetical protein [Caudoviricetes sp.]